MKVELVKEIADRINSIAKADGVHATVNYNPFPLRRKPSNMEIWDIELTYSNYHYGERFNSDMHVGDSDVDRVCAYLLKDLFCGYFREKLSLDN